jgi:hypothetical protein
MFRKLLKYLKVIDIDVLIYSMTKETILAFPELDYTIQLEVVNENKKKYFIQIEDKIIHQSTLFKSIYLLQLIQKKGPTIGECFTNEEFKGKSIYPFVINYIAKDAIINNNQKEVFIIVNSDNVSSIRGIEKAGFTIHTKIKANRFLFFHYNVTKTVSFSS